MDAPAIHAKLEANKALVRRFFLELVNERRYEIIPEIFSPTVQLRVGTRPFLRNEGFDGHDGVLKWLRHFHEAFSDCQDEILAQWAEGDQVITHICYRGTHDGVWLGQPPTGEKIIWTAVAINTVEDGKIVRKTGAIDQADVFRQLGWLKV